MTTTSATSTTPNSLNEQRFESSSPKLSTKTSAITELARNESSDRIKRRQEFEELLDLKQEEKKRQQQQNQMEQQPKTKIVMNSKTTLEQEVTVVTPSASPTKSTSAPSTATKAETLQTPQQKAQNRRSLSSVPSSETAKEAMEKKEKRKSWFAKKFSSLRFSKSPVSASNTTNNNISASTSTVNQEQPQPSTPERKSPKRSTWSVATFRRLLGGGKDDSKSDNSSSNRSPSPVSTVTMTEKRAKRKGLHFNEHSTEQIINENGTTTIITTPTKGLQSDSRTSLNSNNNSSKLTSNSPSSNKSNVQSSTSPLHLRERTVSTVLARCNGIHLDFSNFQLTNEVPDTAEIAENLISLDLSKNLFIRWPQLSPFVSLLTLDLSHNQLQQLPDSFGTLINLRSLFLNSNKLTRLNESITQLVQLEKLSLANNNISELCPDIGQLVKLEVLNLSGN